MPTTGINTYDDVIIDATRNPNEKVEKGFFDLSWCYFAVMKPKRSCYPIGWQ